MSIRPQWQRRRAILLASLLLGTVSTGCPSSDEQSSTPTVTVALEGAPANLDPRFALDAYSSRILDTVLRGLIRIGPDGRPQPDLASAWTQPQPTRLALELKPNQTFHDGTTITPDIVKQTLDTLRDPELASPRGAALEAVTAVRTTNSGIVIELDRPYAPILVALALPILHPSQVTSDRIERPVGSGPYRLESKPNRDEIVVTAVDEKSSVQRIRFRTVPDPTSRIFALETGEADLAQNSIPAGELARLDGLEQLAVERYPGWNVSYLGFRIDHAILADVRVRKAIALAINRRPILETILAGTGRLTGSLIPPDHWAYRPGTGPTYDPAAAAALLDEAGFADPDGNGPKPRFELSYKTSTNPERIRIAQAIAADLNRVGIDVEVRSLEFGTFFEDVRRGNFEMYGLTWVGVVEPDLLHYALHSESVPPEGANRGRYTDAELDQLLEAARGTLDTAERRELYVKAQGRIANTLPVIPLWAQDTVIVHNTRLQGFTPLPGGSWRPLAHAQLTGTP